ncbi:hypothetical protein niasHS_003638 [Heterodera schachtii]|uniref:Ubiquitin carboxyl-terminal hydrolase n=1 Tax=Heterodera schachtii TaxID=97005 RepID=A0ABD2KHJ4_HETSC
MQKIYERPEKYNGGGRVATIPFSNGALPTNHSLYSLPVRYPKGLCGLANLGNTCFMNSALQCLSNIPELATFFINGEYSEQINAQNPLGTQGKLAQEFAELLKNMWSGRYCTFRPFRLKCVVGMFATRFNGFAQQDSHEFIAFLLDGLHEDLNRRINHRQIANNKMDETEKREDDEEEGHCAEDGKSEEQNAIEEKRRKEPKVSEEADTSKQQTAEEAWEEYKRVNDSIVIDLLHGQLKSSLTCNVCGKVSVKFDPFCFLSVPIPPRPLKESASIMPMPTNGQILKTAVKSRKSSDNLMQLTAREEERHRNAVENLTLTQRSLRSNYYGLEYLLWFLIIAREWLIRPWTGWATDLYRHFFSGPISLEQCLGSFFSVDYLHGDDMYKCEQCKRLRNGTKICSLTRLPQVLVIHLKRFRNEGMYNVKLGSKVAFPLTDLDLRPFIHSEAQFDPLGCPNPTKYDLCGLITHKGQNLEYGHYVAYCRNSDDLDWYEFDDANVTRVNSLEVLSQEAYILFYRQKETLEDEEAMEEDEVLEEEEEWVEANSSDEMETEGGKGTYKANGVFHFYSYFLQLVMLDQQLIGLIGEEMGMRGTFV